MKSYLYLNGTEIDFKDEVMGRGFRLQEPQRHQLLRLRQQLPGISPPAGRTGAANAQRPTADAAAACCSAHVVNRSSVDNHADRNPKSKPSPTANTSGGSSPTSKPTRAPGLNEEIIRFISHKKERAGVAARMAAQGVSPLADDGQSRNWAHGPLSADRLPEHHLLLGPQAKAEEPGRSRSGTARRPTKSSAFRWRSAQMSLAGVAVDAVFDSVSVATTFQEKLGRKGHHLLLVQRSGARASRNWCRSTWARWSRTRDNYFATLNTAVFTDGSFCYIPKGVNCPMELSTYFRINAKNTGQFERTLIIADEGAYVSYLEGCTAPMRDENQLHAAVVELVALDNADDQILHRAELVSRRQGRQRRHLQLRHQARRLPRRQLQNLLDAGRNRLGHHLEIPKLHPAGRQQRRRVLLRRPDQQPPAGRHRHQDDPHRQEHPQHDRLQGHHRRPRAEHAIAAW